MYREQCNISQCAGPVDRKAKFKEGWPNFVYPFEGRFVHEGLASLLGYRLSLFRPFSFSISLNDYGFELFSDQDIPIEDGVVSHLFLFLILIRRL